MSEITAERSDDPRGRRLPGRADFWRLWLIGLIVFTVRWIEMLVFAVFAYQVTGSAFIVTMLTMLRMLPLALFGAFMGAVFDRVDRRQALLAMPVILFAISIAAMVLAWAGRLAVLAFINGVAWASDNALRRVMIGDVVGGGGMATAMALDTGANNASRMLGPALGGALLAAWGAAAPFAAAAGLYAVAIGLGIGLRHRNHVAAKPAVSMFGRIAEGLNAMRHNRKLSGIFAITAIFNIFDWPFLSLVPVIGKDTLGLGPQGVGVLSSMDGVGAMLGAIALVLLAQPARYPAIFVGGVILFQAMQIAFALTAGPRLAGLFLLVAGFSHTCFVVMQATMIYREVTPQMRTRMLGLLSVCIGVGPIGFVQVGFLAQMIGVHAAIVTTALEGIVAVGLAFPLWRHIGEKPGIGAE